MKVNWKVWFVKKIYIYLFILKIQGVCFVYNVLYGMWLNDLIFSELRFQQNEDTMYVLKDSSFAEWLIRVKRIFWQKLMCV